jgi:putative oxidoreductase
MLEFKDFLQLHGFPFPLFCAFLSVAVQFTGGVLFILGAFVRPVSLIILINFIVALVMVHVGDSYEQYYPALQLVAVSLFLLFNGAGKPSIDEWLAQKREVPPVSHKVA